MFLWNKRTKIGFIPWLLARVIVRIVFTSFTFDWYIYIVILRHRFALWDTIPKKSAKTGPVHELVLHAWTSLWLSTPPRAEFHSSTVPMLHINDQGAVLLNRQSVEWMGVIGHGAFQSRKSSKFFHSAQVNFNGRWLGRWSSISGPLQ